MPAITIGIPIYNCAPYLEDALRSVFAQTHKDWELILADDGSSDDSLTIARSIVDPRVRVLSDGINRGLAARLNQIAAEARHNWVARMDADDLMDPSRIARQMALFVERPELQIVSCGTYSMTADERLVGARGKSRENIRLEEVLAGKVGLVHAACIFRREWLLRCPYDETVRRSEDLELWARTAAAGELHATAIPDPLYVYREDLNITVPKMIAAYRFEAELIDRYSTGLAWSRLRSRNLVKRVVARACAFPPARRKLQARRNPMPLDVAAKANFEKMLKNIKATPLPGRGG